MESNETDKVPLRTEIRESMTRPTGPDRCPAQPVFVVDDTFFRARNPKPLHWSIAWSDLMMTMFVLFLTLFVYQLAHRQFLSETSPEVVAGTAMTLPLEDTGRIFHPISPTISDQPADRIRKLAAKPVREDEIDRIFEQPVSQPTPIETAPATGPAAGPDKTEATPAQPTHAGTPPGSARKERNETPTAAPAPSGLPVADATATADSGQPAPAAKPAAPAPPSSTEQPAESKKEIIARIYDLSRTTLSREKLERFASVDLIPDKAMRIILTGDLLFPLGQAELTDKARQSLAKLLPVIRKTPYMINVVGHTDSVPMHSGRFASNWELSTARASRVARFLIEQGHIPPRQIVVSGYSYFRPVKPNTTAANRRANRRVEIILSREPAPPVTATPDNLP